MSDHRPPRRLDRALEYADERAAYLDVRDAIAAAIDATPGDATPARADLVIAHLRETLTPRISRRLASDRRYRDAVAAFVVAAVLPLPGR